MRGAKARVQSHQTLTIIIGAAVFAAEATIDCCSVGYLRQAAESVLHESVRKCRLAQNFFELLRRRVNAKLQLWKPKLSCSRAAVQPYPRRARTKCKLSPPGGIYGDVTAEDDRRRPGPFFRFRPGIRSSSSVARRCSVRFKLCSAMVRPGCREGYVRRCARVSSASRSSD